MGLPIDHGLLERFRRAGVVIDWRVEAPPKAKSPATRSKSGPTLGRRIAHLNDEEARVVEHRAGKAYAVVATSGPLGALTVLLALDERGPPEALEAHEADAIAGFPDGALSARWGPIPLPEGGPIP